MGIDRLGPTGGDRRLQLGQDGEDLAANWYEAEGYALLERNWRCREGEIDIVAARGSLTVFCEVKTRSSARFGLPAEAVGRAKQLRARRLAALWFAARAGSAGRSGQRQPQGGPVRFDVACVMAGKLEVIEGAF
jgi:putative endonuclease